MTRILSRSLQGACVDASGVAQGPEFEVSGLPRRSPWKVGRDTYLPMSHAHACQGHVTRTLHVSMRDPSSSAISIEVA